MQEDFHVFLKTQIKKIKQIFNSKSHVVEKCKQIYNIIYLTRIETFHHCQDRVRETWNILQEAIANNEDPNSLREKYEAFEKAYEETVDYIMDTLFLSHFEKELEICHTLIIELFVVLFSE